jgi:hypothetical protein
MRRLPDGRFLLAGYSGSPVSSLAVKRTLPVALGVGTAIDPAFGTGGTALLSIPGHNADGRAAGVDCVGRIVVAGAAIAGTAKTVLVARFAPNGMPDTTFAPGGYFQIPLQARNGIAPALLRQRDGSFIIANGSDDGLFLARIASSQSAGIADHDGDGIPDALDAGLGFDPCVKDNNIFSPGLGSAYLFTMQQFRDFVGHEGDDGSIRFWANAIATGTFTRAQAIEAFLSAPEFAGVMAPAARLYFATFLRVPDYAGLVFNAGLVRNGTLTHTQLANYFAASPEFIATYGALDNVQFVTLLYQNILGRAPDAPGLAGWTAALDAGTYSRGQVLLGFADSPEYQAAVANEVFVTLAYAGMLRRSPDAAGFSAWVSLLDGGMARTAMIDGFFLSIEYHGRFLP